MLCWTGFSLRHGRQVRTHFFICRSVRTFDFFFAFRLLVLSNWLLRVVVMEISGHLLFFFFSLSSFCPFQLHWVGPDPLGYLEWIFVSRFKNRVLTTEIQML